MKGTYSNYFKGEKKTPAKFNNQWRMLNVHNFSEDKNNQTLISDGKIFFLILDRFFFLCGKCRFVSDAMFEMPFLFLFPSTQDSRVNNANNSNLNLKSRSNSFSKRTFSISIPSKMPISKTIQRSKRYTESSPRKQQFHM